MKTRNFLLAALILLAFANAETNDANTSLASPVLLKGKIDELDSSCNAAGITISSRTLPCQVTRVRLGSPALYAGVAENDKILSAQISEKKMALLIERNGQKFSVYLPLSPVKVAATVTNSAVPIVSAKPMIGLGIAGQSLMPRTSRNSRGLYQHVGISPVVWTRMGLCGSWDSGGEGAQHFRILADELFRNEQLGNAWVKWQTDIATMVQGLSSKLDGGVASVHLVVEPNGAVTDYSQYDGPERPYRDSTSSRSTEQLISILRTQHLPPFPTGSQAPDAHVLIYVTSNGAKSVFEHY
jgi:hypothetical protein